jgi:tetratricopeptide (TPR) repeat protein
MESAIARAGQPVKRGTMAHDHEIYMTLADTAAQLRDADALREFTPALEELARRDNHRLYLPIAERAWGVAQRLAGESAEAETRLNHALEMFGELSARWQIGRTLLELGELELARNTPERAGEYFSRALAEFEALGAMPDAARVRAILEKK